MEYFIAVTFDRGYENMSFYLIPKASKVNGGGGARFQVLSRGCKGEKHHKSAKNPLLVTKWGKHGVFVGR